MALYKNSTKAAPGCIHRCPKRWIFDFHLYTNSITSSCHAGQRVECLYSLLLNTFSRYRCICRRPETFSTGKKSPCKYTRPTPRMHFQFHTAVLRLTHCLNESQWWVFLDIYFVKLSAISGRSLSVTFSYVLKMCILSASKKQETNKRNLLSAIDVNWSRFTVQRGDIVLSLIVVWFLKLTAIRFSMLPIVLSHTYEISRFSYQH